VTGRRQVSGDAPPGAMPPYTCARGLVAAGGWGRVRRPAGAGRSVGRGSQRRARPAAGPTPPRPSSRWGRNTSPNPPAPTAPPQGLASSCRVAPRRGGKRHPPAPASRRARARVEVSPRPPATAAPPQCSSRRARQSEPHPPPQPNEHAAVRRCGAKTHTTPAPPGRKAERGCERSPPPQPACRRADKPPPRPLPPSYQLAQPLPIGRPRVLGWRAIQRFRATRSAPNPHRSKARARTPALTPQPHPPNR
jgi:hypothetical protein